MAALPLPVAILDDLICGTGNEVIQDGDRKRKGRHLAPPPQWGLKNAPYTTMILRMHIKNLQIDTVQINSYTETERSSGRLPRSSLGMSKRLPSPSMIGTPIPAKSILTSKAFFLDLFKRLIINLATEMPYGRKVTKVAHDEIVVYGPV